MYTLLFGRLIQILLQIFTLRVVATYLSTYEIGRLSLVTTTSTFFSLLLINPVGMFIVRRFNEWITHGVLKKHLKLYLFYLLFVSIFAVIFLKIAIITGLLSFPIQYLWLTFLVVCTILFSTSNQTVISFLNMLELRSSYMIFSVGTQLGGLLISLGLMLYMPNIAEWWVVGLLAGQFLFALMASIAFLKHLNLVRAKLIVTSSEVRTSELPFFLITPVQKMTLLNFAIPVSLSVGFNWLQGQGYRFYIEKQLGLDSLGLFFAAFSISTGIINAFDSVYSSYFQPLFYKKISHLGKEEQAQAWNHYAYYILPSLLLLVVFASVLADDIVFFMLPAKFKDASKYLVWGLVVEGARILMNVYGMVAHATMRTSLLLIPNAIGAILSFALIYILVPQMREQGVGLGLIMAAIPAALVIHFMMKKELSIRLPYKSLLSTLSIGFIFYVLAYCLRWGFSLIPSLPHVIEHVAVLSVVGSVFVGAQWFFLKPILRERTAEKSPTLSEV